MSMEDSEKAAEGEQASVFPRGPRLQMIFSSQELDENRAKWEKTMDTFLGFGKAIS